jgi:hypothetical protein
MVSRLRVVLDDFALEGFRGARRSAAAVGTGRRICASTMESEGPMYDVDDD